MKAKDINTYSLLLSEALFIVFPFIVIAIILFYKNDAKSIFHYPDWALAASILNGQSVIKIVSGAIASTERTEWQRVSLVVSLLIIICFVPSLIFLTLILISETPSSFLITSQVLIFVLSLIVFFWVGKTGHDLAEKSLAINKKPNK